MRSTCGAWCRDDAEASLVDYFRVFPEDHALCGDLLNLVGPLDGRLALVALCVPELTVEFLRSSRSDQRPEGFADFFWRSFGGGPDLPLRYRGSSLTGHVEALLGLRTFWEVQDGFTPDGLRRQFERGQTLGLREPRFHIYPPSLNYRRGVPFGLLVARGELESLGPENGLTQKLSEAVIRWADEASDTLPEAIRNQSGPLPDALRQIILLNRYRLKGDVNGMFAGKAAWRLLHTRFPLSQAARDTPYWYDCHNRRSCQW